MSSSTRHDSILSPSKNHTIQRFLQRKVLSINFSNILNESISYQISSEEIRKFHQLMSLMKYNKVNQLYVRIFFLLTIYDSVLCLYLVLILLKIFLFLLNVSSVDYVQIEKEIRNSIRQFLFSVLEQIICASRCQSFLWY